MKGLTPRHGLCDGIRLKQYVTLYHLLMPFAFVRELDWTMDPIVTVVALTLMGIEGIANQIEMPFGKNHAAHGNGHGTEWAPLYQ